MLLALFGVTGVGKSYYKDVISEKLNFEKVKIITTREMREGEKNNVDKIFLKEQELQKLRDKGEIAYEFELLGNTYAFTKAELFSEKNTVFEFHYSYIYDLKKICPNVCAIYIFPKNIEVAKEKLRQRNLKPSVECARINEIEEHYKTITTDDKLRSMFDYTLYNNYDKESEEEIIKLVSRLMIEKR